MIFRIEPSRAGSARELARVGGRVSIHVEQKYVLLPQNIILLALLCLKQVLIYAINIIRRGERARKGERN